MPSNARLLIVEDDDDMRLLLGRLLAADGYEIESVANSAAAIKALATQEPDLVLLDIVLGSEDGRDLLQELRRMSDVPVVFLTGRSHEIDRIAGLKMGADDYVVKPFSAGELSARVESVLRRSRRPGRPNGSVVFGELRIDLAAREIEVADRKIDLTPKEFDVLAFLAASPRQAFSRAQLLDHVWSSSAEWQGEATVTEHVRRLRRKIEADADNPRWITTVRGVGYRFEP
jgi:DNA-binding response OmpR family regulator